jgi:hypothetical protein
MPKYLLCLSASELNDFTQTLRQLPVTAAEKSYGSAFTLFFGATTQRLVNSKGRSVSFTESSVALDVEWDWRLEFGTEIQCGSSDSRPEIAEGIAVLVGQTIVRLNATGAIPELEVAFTSGHVLRTMAATRGHSAWSITLSENLWVTPHEGQVWLHDGPQPSRLTIAEVAALEAACATARRWRRLNSASADKKCGDCRSYVRLDGEGALLDYGVCTAADSPFDGRVVQRSEQCEKFSANES